MINTRIRKLLKAFILVIAVFAFAFNSVNAQDYYQSQTLGAGNNYGAPPSQHGGGGYYPPPTQQQAPPQNQVRLSAVYVAAGAPVNVAIQSTLSSQFSQVGETFTTTLTGPLFGSNGQMAVPAGSTVQGQVVAVTPAGRGGKPGSIDLRLTSVVTPDGKRYPLSASVNRGSFQLSAQGGRTSNIVKSSAIGAGAGALSGLVGGAISGGRKGKATAIGTGIGGGIGLLGGVIKRGKEFVLSSGTNVPFVLDAPLQINVANNRIPTQGGGFGGGAHHGGHGGGYGSGAHHGGHGGGYGGGAPHGGGYGGGAPQGGGFQDPGSHGDYYR